MRERDLTVARLLFAPVFLVSGGWKLLDWGFWLAYTEAFGLPAAPLLLAGSVVVELGAGLALAVGYRQRVVGAVLALYLIPTTVLFHPFWAAGSDQVVAQTTNFLKNLAIIGGLVLFVALGESRPTVRTKTLATLPRRHMSETEIDSETQTVPWTDASAAPSLVGHVHLNVRALAPAIGFYTEVLGLDVAEREGRYAFLSWGERHHDVALQALGDDAAEPSRGVGLYHVAFEVSEPATLTTIHERLRERDVSASPVDHGISKALYFRDPDGNEIEVYVDTRAVTGRNNWRGRTVPFDPERVG